ncbi:hypothetical protein [Nonomuraea sediminis]|uniref:hypothetical protein n=1 Tax=Nonomuraea sediminis TaxID=2835864 RepID=UPI001BDC6E37|nr:hypothetical protein [Nonomuraea sediminis]
MRSQRLIPALVLAAGLAIPAAVATASPAGAKAAATTCRVEVDYVDLYDVDEKDGTDEVKIDLAGYYYPSGSKYVAMSNGDRAYSGNFANPTTTIGTSGWANFSLREVDPPIVGSGYNLGSINAYGSTCATLSTGQIAYVYKTITGTQKTYYSYYIRLVMTGL